jgi:NAD(P)-dependent dehydrogenase (short-subunit alcohol dehydrogenase family)
MKTLAELQRMDGRAAIITGGAGHLGRVFTDVLLELGAKVLVVDRVAPQRADVVSHVDDLADVDSTARIVAAATQAFGRVDALVHCAAFTGASHLSGWAVPLEQQSAKTFAEALAVNTTAAFALAQACAPLLAAHQGCIVNVSSIYGEVGPDLRLYEGTTMGNPAAYAASKGGIVALSRYLATVLAPKIRVNTLSPGGIERSQPASFQARYTARTPLGRMATEEDLKGAFAFLVSGASAYVTGQNLIVDGGFTAW